MSSFAGAATNGASATHFGLDGAGLETAYGLALYLQFSLLCLRVSSYLIAVSKFPQKFWLHCCLRVLYLDLDSQ